MDEELLTRVVDLLRGRLDRVGFEGLLPEERDYYLMFELDDQVGVGTLEQYLWNPSGDHAEQAHAALQRLGAVRLADILRRAMDLLPGGWCADQEQRIGRVEALPAGAFDALMDEYRVAVKAEDAAAEAAVGRIDAAYRRVGLYE